MNCPTCGSKNPEGSVFCSVCSTPMGGEETWKTGATAAGRAPDPYPGGPAPHYQPSEDGAPLWATDPDSVLIADVHPPVGGVYRGLPTSVAEDAGFVAWLKVLGPFAAFAVGGVLLLRLTAEILIHFFPGRIINGTIGVDIVVSNTFSPLGIGLGIIAVVMIAQAVGFLAGRMYPERGWLAGVIAGASVVALEAVLSLAKVGTVPRTMDFFKGKAGFNWPYTFMLLAVFVSVGGLAAWFGSGMGLERTKKPSVKFTVAEVCITVIGILLVMAVTGQAVTASRAYSNEPLQNAFNSMELAAGWKGQIYHRPPDKNENLGLAGLRFQTDIGYLYEWAEPGASSPTYYLYLYDNTAYISQDKINWQPYTDKIGLDLLNKERAAGLVVQDHWAGIWEGKATTASEVTGFVRDWPLIEHFASQLKGVAFGDANKQFKAYIWTDVPHEKVYCMNFLLEDDKGGGPGSGGRIDVIFFDFGLPFLKVAPGQSMPGP